MTVRDGRSIPGPAVEGAQYMVCNPCRGYWDGTDQSHIFVGVVVLSLGPCVDLGSFKVGGECEITQCCLCDRGAATLEKHEG